MHSRIFLEIGIKVAGNQRETLLPILTVFEFGGFMETDDTLFCYIEKDRWTDSHYKKLTENLRLFFRSISSNIPFTIREIIEENWNEKWERSIQPIEIGEKLVVVPSWCAYDNISNKIILHIDPKMSFGTGYHETTRLTLMLLERYISKEAEILDVGTGTGILAIAAVKLGAAKAMGIDIDPWSIDNARENVILNKVIDKVDVSESTPEKIKNMNFTLITSNITLNANICLLNEYYRLLSINGMLLLSGFLKSDIEFMKDNLTNNKFRLVDVLNENEWVAVGAVKTV